MYKRIGKSWIVAGSLALAFSACSEELLTAPPAPSSVAGAAAAGSAAGAAGAGATPTVSSATATLAPFGAGSTVSGTANFSQTGADVTVTITLTNCPDGAHPVHIHAGTACTDMTTQMGHWGGDGPPQTRGEGIPEITCAGGTGTVTHTRVASAAPTLAWSLGGPSADSNLLQHVIVVHNPDKTRIACGQIH